MPTRIQRRRQAGWRLPAGAVCVTRPGRYGNPFVIERIGDLWTVRCNWPGRAEFPDEEGARVFSIGRHRHHLMHPQSRVVPLTVEDVVRELRGKDVACWCRLDQLCHGDTLLDLAN